MNNIDQWARERYDNLITGRPITDTLSCAVQLAREAYQKGHDVGVQAGMAVEAKWMETMSAGTQREGAQSGLVEAIHRKTASKNKHPHADKLTAIANGELMQILDTADLCWHNASGGAALVLLASEQGNRVRIKPREPRRWQAFRLPDGHICTNPGVHANYGTPVVEVVEVLQE